MCFRSNLLEKAIRILASLFWQLKTTDLQSGGSRPKRQTGNLASALYDFCRRENVSILLLDGPQGWKSPQAGIPDMRICERVLNTPGKVGEIGESEEPRSKRRDIFQGKSQYMAAAAKLPFAIHPHSKLQGILAFSNKPITYLNFANFSINLFHIVRIDYG
jgi:hypothetical protein